MGKPLHILLVDFLSEKKCRSLMLFSVLFFYSFLGVAQNDPLFTQYMNNTIVVNPAYAGSHDVIQALVMGRKQWVGFDGAPQTFVAAFHAPVRKFNIGLGADVILDRIGPQEKLDFSINGSYRIKLSESKVDRVRVIKRGRTRTFRKRKERVDSYLAFGLKASYSQVSLKVGSQDFVETSDALINSESDRNMNFGAGVYFYSPNFYLGFSIPRIFKNSLDISSASNGERSFRELHYYLNGGHLFRISPSVVFKPTFMLRVVPGAAPLVELSPNFLFYEKVWLGMGYRVGGDITALLQYYFTPQLRIGYSYDMTANDLVSYNTGSHELSISFDLKLKKGDMDCKVYF